jgi:uncharacterized membrane protein
METTTFPTKTNSEIIKEAREAFKGQWGGYFLAMLLSSIVSMAIGGSIYVVFLILTSILSLILSSGLVSILAFILAIIGAFISFIFLGRIWNWQYTYVLKRSRGEDISYTDFKSIFQGISSFSDLKTFFLDINVVSKNIVPSLTLLLSILGIMFGYILLIVPGVIISFMYVPVPFISAEEKDLSAMDVLRKSSKLMHGNKMKLFWCYVKLIPLMILCSLPCGLGLLWFGPYLSFVIAKFYDAHKA